MTIDNSRAKYVMLVLSCSNFVCYMLHFQGLKSATALAEGKNNSDSGGCRMQF